MPGTRAAFDRTFQIAGGSSFIQCFDEFRIVFGAPGSSKVSEQWFMLIIYTAVHELEADLVQTVSE
jgi:hypothetical protein